MLIDTHAHLDFPEFDRDREQLLNDMRGRGIRGALVPAIGPENWHTVIRVAEQYKLYFALGIHPWWMQEDKRKQQMAELERLIESHRQDKHLVAIGETGLDALKGPALDVQLGFVEQHMELAHRFDLPLILHCVKSVEPLLMLLERTPDQRGVVHGFSGSLELAQRFSTKGMKIGVGGLLLNPNAKKLRHCVANIAVESLVVETDSPAMAPRGIDRNTPMTLLPVVEEIARLRQCCVVSLKEQLAANAAQLFELS